jgi:hypothetical protein
MSTKTDKAPKEEVTLLKPIRHRGIDLPKDTKIQVRPKLRDWMASKGIVPPRNVSSQKGASN